MSKSTPVLIIDDDEIVRRALEHSLKLHGFRVYAAKDGPTGLKLAQEKKPAFVLLDWMMPEMDGLEVLAELKHDRRTERIPVFMLTDKGMIGDLDEAFEIGADDYITKPLHLRELGKIVKAKWKTYTNRTGVLTKSIDLTVLGRIVKSKWEKYANRASVR